MKKSIIILGAIYIVSILLSSCGDAQTNFIKEEKNNVSNFDTTGLPSININEGWDREQSLSVVYNNFSAYHAGAGYSKLKEKPIDGSDVSGLNIYLTGEKLFEFNGANYFLTVFSFLMSTEDGWPGILPRAEKTKLGLAIFREFNGKFYLIASLPYYNAPGMGQLSSECQAEILEIGENKLGIRVFLPVVGGQGNFQEFNSIVSVDFNNNKMELVAEIQVSSSDPDNASLNYENDISIDYSSNISGFHNLLVKDKSGNLVETYKYNDDSKKYERKKIFEKRKVDVHIPSQGG